MKKNLLLLFWALIAALLIGEAGLALFGPEMIRPPLYPGDIEPFLDDRSNPHIGWTMTRNWVIPETTADYTVTYKSNHQGFRDTREFTANTPGRRIAFLGDSYTFGSGVTREETFAIRLERMLENTSCYNYGIGGFGVDQMWMTLRHYAMAAKPHLVVLSFIRHDLDRSLSAYWRGYAWKEKPAFRLVDGELVPMTIENRPSGLHRFLSKHSKLVGLWHRVENSLSRRWAIGYRWRLNRAIFEAIRDDCRDAGIPLVVVHIPINRRGPMPMLAREFDAMGITFLDLNPLLPPDADRLYYPNDRHLNAEGHRFTAEAIRDLLQAEGLVRQGEAKGT